MTIELGIPTKSQLRGRLAIAIVASTLSVTGCDQAQDYQRATGDAGATRGSTQPTKIAFASKIDDNYEIFVINADGSELKRLTHDTSWDVLPAWSPDGTKIAWVTNRAGRFNVGLMNADGSNQAILRSVNVKQAPISWSPDGARLAYVGDDDSNGEICIMNRDGYGPHTLTSHPAFDTDPSWSPDGTSIAFSSVRGLRRIYVMDADGSKPIRNHC